MRWTKCPPILASIIIGPSVPSSSPMGGNEIIVSGDKVWVILCLATLYMAVPSGLLAACPFLRFPPFLLPLP
ncbi:hypothetical protein Tco_1357131, partial [Tanacetum coccineum]